MDSTLLVDDRVDDGVQFLERFQREGVPVVAAVWIQTREDGPWDLYLASPAVDEENMRETYRTLHPVLSKTVGSSISFSNITLIGANNPIVKDILEIQRRHPGGIPLRTRRPKLGNVEIHEAYIYPAPSGGMTRDEVLRAVAGMMNRSGTIPPATVLLRDGSTITGVPFGVAVRTNAPAKVDVTFHNMSTGVQRIVDADEISRIR